ncbi:polysaccharide export protein [Nitritalea halalkaliphila LW7]|uniref:Polysaccharide export protein n=1 Tax=Nitritalea halalkaliphila LW7 TaxID=1189621 RepID=I5C629_9BACT|nr:polysaccharide export protein [Nitritalea halalkaliphila LW7]
MQDLGDARPVATEGPMAVNKEEMYKLQYNDVVDIQIQTTSEELNAIFGISVQQGQMAMAGVQGANNGGDIFFMQGYTLDEEGNVDLPLIGAVNLLSLTVQEAKHKIEELMLAYIRKDDLYVRVRLGGIRFATLGEFVFNGNHTIMANRVNIFQAIAHAGDMTPVAKRHEIVLVRQYPEGTKSFRINLNDKRIVESEFFFLRPNDMLYAEPLRVRELGAGVNFVQTLQFTVSILTAALLIINTVN